VQNIALGAAFKLIIYRLLFPNLPRVLNLFFSGHFLPLWSLRAFQQFVFVFVFVRLGGFQLIQTHNLPEEVPYVWIYAIF